MKWPAPLRKLLSSSRPKARLAGHLDRVERRLAAGWAADLDDYGTPLLIVLVADGAPVAVTRAETERPDLKLAGHGEGRHGYEFTTPDLTRRGVRRVETYGVQPATAASLGLVDGEERLAPGLTPATFAAMVEMGRPGLFRLGGMEVPARPAAPASTYDRAGPGAIVCLDVYDLLAFLELRRRVTGIQRVVSGLIRTSLAAPARYPAFEFCIPTEEGEIVVLARAALAALVEKALTGTAEMEELRRDVASLRAAARRVELRAGDRYVVTGAYWINPDYAATLLRLRGQGVVTGVYVYDLIPFAAPQFVTASNRAGVVERGIEVLSLCDVFLTISAFVERQLLAFLASETGRHPPTRAVTLPHELPSGASAPAGIAHPRPYVLCVATIEGRKNHLLLFDVWAALIRRHGADAVPDLVLVGNWGWAIAEFQERCLATGFLGGRIVVRRDIDDGELLALYRDCLFATFPSFLEGWGLPVGESLAVGKLCIASNASSIPEVGGDFADYIDPHDHLGAVAIYERAIFDADYRARREREIATGFRVRTWEETTAAFHEAIDELVREAPPRRLPLLRAGVAYGFAGLAEDVRVSWEEKLARLALADGWHPLEPWGAWSSGPEATLRFFTDAAPSEELTVTLTLVPPPSVGELRLRLEARHFSGPHAEVPAIGRPRSTRDGGASFDASLREAPQDEEVRSSALHEIEVTARAGEGGLVEVTLRSDVADRHAEGLRELYVGLAGLRFRRKDD